MSKFVFSSFVIGVGTSAFVSLAVNERLFERKLMFQPKENTDELVQAYYEQKLREKIQEKQLQLRKSQLRELREKFNSEVIPVVVDASNKLFSKSPQEIIDEISSKFK